MIETTHTLDYSFSDRFFDLEAWFPVVLLDLPPFVFKSIRESVFPWRAVSGHASSTAFLDGLRGVASLFVSLYHLRNGYYGSVHVGYGTGPDDRSIFQLPIIRLLFAGTEMVTIFFVVSGYSLSLSAFRAIKAEDIPKALDRIRSSIFRRFLRLYLPTIAASFIAFCCISLGMYNLGNRMDIRGAYRDPEPTIYNSTGAQFTDWLQHTGWFIDVSEAMRHFSYDDQRHIYYPNSWSIPVEFTCSIVLFLILLAMCKLRTRPRVLLHVFLILYCHAYQAHYLWTFLMGAGLAHLNVMMHAGDMRSSKQEGWNWKVGFKLGVFVLGLYLLSYPEWSGSQSLGYGFLTPLLPRWREPHWFLHTIGASFVAWTASNTAQVQSIFSSRFARYLGRISFGLYLIHGIVIHVLALWMLPLIWRVTGRSTALTSDLGFFLGVLIYLPICLFLADLFTRLFDEPSVRFARWVESSVISGDESQDGYRQLPMSETTLVTVAA